MGFLKYFSYSETFSQGLDTDLRTSEEASLRYFFCGSFTSFLSCVCYAFVRVCLYVPCGHLLGKGPPLGSCLWCQTVSLTLSHWYPGSGAVLDCIYS